MNAIRSTLFVLATLMLPMVGVARSTDTAPVHLSLRLGVNLGGTMPLPMPRAIRGIEDYNPQLHFAIEGRAAYRFKNSSWGLTTGLRLEQKGMNTDARVRNYFVNVVADDGATLRGAFYGDVYTRVRLSLLTIPVLATWQPHPRWTLSAGPTLSINLGGDFSGYAYNGYIRKDSPIGERTAVTKGAYEYGDDLCTLHWGMLLGVDYQFSRRWSATAEYTMGVHGIFPSTYTNVSYTLYPVFATIGVSYKF